MSNTCTRATARPGSAIRRRAGSGRAPRSAACPAKSRARCCAAGTPTTASRSAISGSASSAPSRASTARTGSKAITANTTIRSSSTQRLVFARHLEAPLFDPATAPALPVASWPKPRLEKAYRNYAMEYVRTAAPVMVQLFGPEDAGYLLHLTGKLIGMQYFDEVARGACRERAAARRSSQRSCARCSTAQDDVAEIEQVRRHVRNPPAELEADGRCRRLSSGLRQGAGGTVRGPRRRLRPPYSGAACARRPAASRRSSGRSAEMPASPAILRSAPIARGAALESRTAPC